MSATTHIIHKVSVEVQTTSAETSSFKEEMDRLIQEAILSSVESYIAEHEDKYKEQSVQIEKLSLDLQLNSLAHNRLDISAQVYQQMDALFSQASFNEGGKSRQVHQQMNDPLSQTNFTEGGQTPGVSSSSAQTQADNAGMDVHEQDILHLSSSEKSSKTFFHFLRTGTLPWWIPDSTRMSAVVNDEKLLELIYEQTSFVQQLQKELKTRTSKLRLIQQFSDSTLLCVFAAISAGTILPNKSSVLSFFKDSAHVIQELSQTQRTAFWFVVSDFSSVNNKLIFLEKYSRQYNTFLTRIPRMITLKF